MNFDDYEQLPTPSTFTNMIAGGAAGVLEHCVMYPMDSIKVIYFLLFSEKNCFFWNWISLIQTRMQSLLPTTSNQTLVSTLKYMIKSEGISRYAIWIIIFIIINIHFKVRKFPLMNSYGESALSDSNQMNIKSTRKTSFEVNCTLWYHTWAKRKGLFSKISNFECKFKG